MKTKINLIFFVFFSVITLTSCRTYLTPAILGNDLSYIPKTMYADSARTILNFPASYGGATSPDSKVIFELGMANISQSHTYKRFNISYGVFGYAGTAENSRTQLTNDNLKDYLPYFKKNISGLGIRLSTGLHSTSANGNTDFRYINFENALSVEHGSYLDFRKEIYNKEIPNYVAVSDRKILWTTGLSTEVIWRARRNHDIKHAFRLFIGGTPGLEDNFKYGAKMIDDIDKSSSGGWIISYFLYVKKFTLTLETANNVNFANKISLGYSL